MKRAYYAYEDIEEYGVAVIATSVKEAKKLAWGNDNLPNENFIDLKAHWMKGAKKDEIQKLDIGVLEDCILALKLGIFSSVMYETCPKCGDEDTTIMLIEDEVMCSNCEDKINE